MTFSLKIALRYLFSRKSHNAINIISGISACGVCVGTMALVCVLSVYNGFESLVRDLFGEFDADLKITLVEGKTFSLSTPAIQQIKQIEDIAAFVPIIEENALARYDEKQTPIVVKGVGSNFGKATNIERIMQNGVFVLQSGGYDYAVIGSGLARQLNVGLSLMRPLEIYVPKRTANINLARPEASFTQRYINLAGIFEVKQAEYDEKYLILPIETAREIYEYQSDIVTALELKLDHQANAKKVKKQVRNILGNAFSVKDRYEQQESFFRIMKVEKWISYLILAFILLIAIFNIVGSLSMLIIEKEQDIATFRNMGASETQIRRIFLYEGWMISVVGALVGIVLGVALCLIQQHFGIIKLGGDDFIINAYPVKLQATDVVLIFFTVVLMGFAAVKLATANIKSEN